MNYGEKVHVEGEIDAFRIGYNSHAEIRVKIGDIKVWIPADLVKSADER